MKYESFDRSRVGKPRGPDWLITEITEPLHPKSVDRPVCTLQMMGAMKCYIQKGVQMRLESHQSEYLAELRRVTVLFVKLDRLAVTYSSLALSNI